MKTIKFISIFALLIGFTFALVQCAKESEQIVADEKDAPLSQRGEITIGGEVVPPPCGINDYLSDNTICNSDGTISKIFQMSNGCNIEVTMDVKICYTTNNPDDYYVNFTNFKWKLAPPVSLQCGQWWIGLQAMQPGEKNLVLDNLIKEMEDKFIDSYMYNFVRKERFLCTDPENTASAKMFKSPCLQRCVTPPSEEEIGFWAYDKPCADDGCCVKTYVYCLKDNGEIFRSGGVELLRPCTNFVNVVCQKGTVPWGECRDNLCK